MRINVDRAISSEDYNYPGGNSFTNAGPGGENIDKSCDDQTCIPSKLSEYDLNNWFYLVRTTLPDGEANIKKEDSNQYTITIRWRSIVDSSNEEEEQSWEIVL